MEIGDTVVIYKTGTLATEGNFGTGTIIEVTPRLYRVKVNNRRFLSGTYLRSSLVCRDGKPGSVNLPLFSIMSISPERVEKIEKEITEREEKEAQRLYEEGEAKRQAEYNALPEAVKVARKLRWFCEMARVETIAQAPLEAMKMIVDWAIANQKEVE